MMSTDDPPSRSRPQLLVNALIRETANKQRMVPKREVKRSPYRQDRRDQSTERPRGRNTFSFLKKCMYYCEGRGRGSSVVYDDDIIILKSLEAPKSRALPLSILL